MSLHILESGIQAVQQKNHVEGARLLRFAIKGGQLSQQLTAIAYLWLAETKDEPAHKLNCYNEALAADADNADAQSRLATLLSSQLPPTPPTRQTGTLPELSPQQPTTTSTQPVQAQPRPPGTVSQMVVGVFGGPNGPGTAFFVSREGLLATTRHVVGGEERVTLELGDGHQLQGEVVRAYPEYDLAFIRINEYAGHMPPITPYPRVPDDMTLIAQSYTGSQFKGRQRPSKRVMAAHWISTDFRKLPDAGGNPIFDERRYLTGMMTKNNSRSQGYLYGVHINAIHRCVENFTQEMQSGDRRTYCPTCGFVSRAIAAGYFYCETCGGVAPPARAFNRYPQDNPYFEQNRIRCSHCGATVGFSRDQRCLRCGQSSSAPAIKT
jgi:hypothetical protein